MIPYSMRLTPANLTTINLIRTFSPNKGKNMNNVTTNEPVEQVNQNFYIDAEGNRVEIPFELNEQTYSGSETTPEETAFIAEDGADHPIH